MSSTSTTTPEPEPEGFYVLYNNCYGGFSINDEARAEYNRRIQEYEADEDEDEKKDYICCNFDPILIDMFLDEEWNTNGTRLNGKYSKLAISWFPIDYKGCVNIEEYDGKETTVVDMGRYFKKKLKMILYDNSLTDFDKVEQIKVLINSKN